MKKFNLCNISVSISGICFWILSLSCSQIAEAQFVKGADIGWLQQMEATGYKFYDSTGEQKSCLQILKDKGINTIRLRVWVNPSNDRINGHCSKAEVVTMAQRAKTIGMRIMIDFHYSDSWADPSKQNKPASWAGHPFSQLLTDLYDHTYNVLDTLKSAGVVPDWVQVGNEITFGMLWPDGSTSNWSQLAQLLNKGYDATKAVDSSIKVVIHVDQGNNNSRFRTFFDNARNNNVRYDVIGMSYYPYWLGSDYTATINNLGINLIDMASRYGKEVMVVETGGDYTLVQDTYDMLVAEINKVKSVPNNKGLGVIYWEPEGEKSWSGYQLSCWGSDGKPTAALNAFLLNPLGINMIKSSPGLKIYPNPNLGGVLKIEFQPSGITSVIRIFSMNGTLLKEQKLDHVTNDSININLAPGIYLVNVETGREKIFRELVVQ